MYRHGKDRKLTGLIIQVFRKDLGQAMLVNTDINDDSTALFQSEGANVSDDNQHQLEGTTTLPIAVGMSKSVKVEILFFQQSDIAPVISAKDQQDPAQILHEPVTLGAKIRVKTVS